MEPLAAWWPYITSFISLVVAPLALWIAQRGKRKMDHAAVLVASAMDLVEQQGQELAALRTELERGKNEVARLEVRIAALDNALHRKDNEIDKLQRRVRELEREKAALEAKNAALEAKNEALEKRVAALERTNGTETGNQDN